VLGGICDGLESYPKEWERCWRMIRIARSFGRSGTLSAFDFGPMPMLIGAAESADVRSFVDGAIGAVIAHDRQHDTPYLETLAAYLREGCRTQACADAMGLHVTTLRYRLSRIQDLFGIGLETAEKRFAIELAIRLHGVIESSEVTVA
jgi:DNA-binding PucR family transcriptional regulator